MLGTESIIEILHEVDNSIGGRAIVDNGRFDDRHIRILDAGYLVIVFQSCSCTIFKLPQYVSQAAPKSRYSQRDTFLYKTLTKCRLVRVPRSQLQILEQHCS